MNTITAPRCTKDIIGALRMAPQQAYFFNHKKVYPEHIILVMLKAKGSPLARHLRKMDLDLTKLTRAINDEINRADEPTAFKRRLPPAETTKALLQAAKDIACDRGDDFIGPEHLLLALIQQPENPATKALLSEKVYSTKPSKEPLDKEVFQTKLANILGW